MQWTIHEYDLVVLLRACNADSLLYVNLLKTALQSRCGGLFAFVDNEVNLPSAQVGEKIAFLKAVGAEYIATQLPLEAGNG